MSPEFAGLLNYARDQFFTISEAFEFRFSFRVSARADLGLIRFYNLSRRMGNTRKK